MKLKRFKIEIEVCGPETCSHEEVSDFMYSLVRESDIASINDTFAIGIVEILEEEECTIEEWNRDTIKDMEIDELI